MGHLALCSHATADLHGSPSKIIDHQACGMQTSLYILAGLYLYYILDWSSLDLVGLFTDGFVVPLGRAVSACPTMELKQLCRRSHDACSVHPGHLHCSPHPQLNLAMPHVIWSSPEKLKTNTNYYIDAFST